MKREGRQHGMVKTYPVPPAPWSSRPNPWGLELSSPTTAGLFTKVSTKPTNHSKFTGKCGRSMCRACHLNPASKSKDKAKGAQRLRSTSNRRLLGFSATSVLNYLDGDDCMDRVYEDDEEEHNVAQVEESNYEISCPPIQIEEDMVENNWINGEDYEEISSCDVVFAWQPEDDGHEDWYLV